MADTCGGLWGEIGSSQGRTESLQVREFLAAGSGGSYPGASSLVQGGVAVRTLTPASRQISRDLWGGGWYGAWSLGSDRFGPSSSLPLTGWVT